LEIALKEKHLLVLPKLVDATVVAESMGCSVKHVYKLAATGQLPHYRIGGLVRFDPDKILAWIQSHEIHEMAA
jgi:excisionase family DNA binding protein